EERADGCRRLVKPVQAFTEAATKLDAVGGVLRLEPSSADTEEGSSATGVVKGGDHLGDESWISEGVGADQQPETDPAGDLGPGGQRDVTLEDRLVGIAVDRQQMVDGPEMVVAE